ncbi:MAG: ATP-grasp domain-containing protein [Spirochaetales bacterium]|nr:ATP-grasp domain-containing protein [Spirochaetales bacterium]
MTEQKTIFILGAGVMQIPAFQAAKSMGWKIIAADGNPAAPGRELADIFEPIDLKDKERLADAVKRHQKQGRVDGVFTAGTDFSASVAWVARECGLPGIPYEVAVNASEKQKMREQFRRHHIPQPAFISVTNPDTVDISPMAFPLVVKPVDNMGARGVRRVDSVEQLHAAVSDALCFSRTHTAIIEEYIDGPEFSLDALVYDGTITLCGIADRHIVFEPWFIEMGHTIPSNINRQTLDAIENVFFSAVKALGITTGAAKGDIRLSKNGPLVGEIAARLSGGYMSGWTYPYCSGIPVTRAALRIAVGLPPGDLSVREKAVSAERAFISIPGIVRSIHGTEDARKSDGIEAFFLRAEPGSRVVFPQNNVEKCGNVISRKPTRKAAIDAAAAALHKLCIRLQPDCEQTDAFLLAENLPCINAFTLACRENIEYLETMPAVFGDLRKLSFDEILVINLPIIQEEQCGDWHGEPIQHALKRLGQYVPVRYVDDDMRFEHALGALFWKAFLRAGVQGGLYVIDSLMDAGSWGRYLTQMTGRAGR